jgi:hypothetical protein
MLTHCATLQTTSHHITSHIFVVHIKLRMHQLNSSHPFHVIHSLLGLPYYYESPNINKWLMTALQYRVGPTPSELRFR